VIFVSLLQPEPRPQKIDQLVIDGHVIPNEVLFTAPTPRDVPYPTLVLSDNLKVVVSFLKQQNKGDNHRLIYLRPYHPGKQILGRRFDLESDNSIKNTIIREIDAIACHYTLLRLMREGFAFNKAIVFS